MDTLPLLRIRLHSCLQTLLDLERKLEAIDVTEPFQVEFTELKRVYNKLEHLPVCEDDVVRIEAATTEFFSELQHLLPQICSLPSDQRFLQ
jgi:hypothetical protein